MKVRLAFPNRGWLRFELVYWILLMHADDRAEVEYKPKVEQPVDSCRNEIVKEFLESDDDYLFMIDDDMQFRKNPLKYVEKDLDIVGFPTLAYQEQHDYPLLWNLSWDDRYGNPIGDDKAEHLGPEKVAAIGTGAMLIARRVLEHPKMKAPFRFEYDEWGIRKIGEDMSFCDRARECGFDVWAAFDVLCGHKKEVDLLRVHTAKLRKGKRNE